MIVVHFYDFTTGNVQGNVAQLEYFSPEIILIFLNTVLVYMRGI